MERLQEIFNQNNYDAESLVSRLRKKNVFKIPLVVTCSPPARIDSKPVTKEYDTDLRM